MWTIETDSNRVQWVSKDLKDRSDLELYLKYFGLERLYTKPDQYISPIDDALVTITYKEKA